MKLEDCKIKMKVRLIPGKIGGTEISIIDKYPDLIGEIGNIDNSRVDLPIYINPDGWWFGLDQIEPYIEPEETEYRQLKDITPKAIYYDRHINDTTGSGFMREFTRFVMNFSLLYDEAVSFTDLVWELENEPEWGKWLIQHGFIEKVVEEKPEEVTYSMGDRIEIDGTQYILACLGIGLIMLVSLVDGNWWDSAKKVKNEHKITHKELQKIVGDFGFTKIEGK